MEFKNQTETFSADPRLTGMFVFAAALEGLNKNEAIRDAMAKWLKERGLTKAMIFSQDPAELQIKYAQLRRESNTLS